MAVLLNSGNEEMHDDSLSLSNQDNKESINKDSLLLAKQESDKKTKDKNADNPSNLLLKYNYYPGTVTDKLHLELYVPYKSEINVSIYNIQGEIRQSLYYNSGQNNYVTESINLSGPPQGIYFLQLKTNKELITEKIIKNNGDYLRQYPNKNGRVT